LLAPLFDESVLLRDGECMDDDVMTHFIAMVNRLRLLVVPVPSPAAVSVAADGASQLPRFSVSNPFAVVLHCIIAEHWILLVNHVFTDLTGSVVNRLCIYDSLPPGDPGAVLSMNGPLAAVVAALVGGDAYRSVQFPRMQRQSRGSNLCGWYVIAWLLELTVRNRQPGEWLQYDEVRMRRHLVSMLAPGAVLVGFPLREEQQEVRVSESQHRLADYKAQRAAGKAARLRDIRSHFPRK
jgi:hypothetical protein